VVTIPSGSDLDRSADEQDRRWRRVLWLFPTGLYVLGSRHGDRRNLMTVSWVSQVATEPRQIGVSLERDAVTLALVRAGGVFALSLLAVDDKAVVRRFVRPVGSDEVRFDPAGHGTMRSQPVVEAPSGAPVLACAVATVDCQVVHIVELGSHSWVVGTVTAAGFGAGVEVGEPEAPDEGSVTRVLSMADTRMHYGG